MKHGVDRFVNTIKLGDHDECRLVVIQDQLQVCPYLPDMIARMPLRLPVGTFSGQMMDSLLDGGYRRSGDFVYRTQCPSCSACEPTRVDIQNFTLSTSMRRVLHRGDASVRTVRGPLQSDAERVALFNLHRRGRGLARSEEPVDDEGYRSFLVESCCDSFELSFWVDETLAAVSIVDQTPLSLSAVYTFFDPSLSRLSLGTYAILKQFEIACAASMRYLYLGMYVDRNAHLNYKARFTPQERLIENRWVRFER